MPRQSTPADSLEAPLKKLTAVSAICLLWACYLVFKDRTACRGTSLVLPSPSRSPPLWLAAGRLFYFRTGRLVKSPLRPRLHRFASTVRRFRGFLSKGRGTYCRFATLVNSLRRLVLLTRAALSPSRPLRFVRGAASTTTASRVNFVSSTVYFVWFNPAGALSSPVRGASSVRGGAASSPSPSRVSTAFVDSRFPSLRAAVTCATLARLGDAASTTTAFRVNPSASTLYFICPESASRRQCDFACPFQGTRLLPPPRCESTLLHRLVISSGPGPKFHRRCGGACPGRGDAASTTTRS